MIAANAASRRTCLALLVGAGMTAPFTAQSEPLAAPPALSSATSQSVELKPLAEAPPLKLERIDGRTVDLRSLRGKVVLLSFWATWRPPCRRELPLLERLQQFVDPRDVEVAGLSNRFQPRPLFAPNNDPHGLKASEVRIARHLG